MPTDMPKTILVIDDDDKLVRMLTSYLNDFGLKVVSANAPSIGLRLLKQTNPDLIVLDVMLPEKSGLDVCKEIRAQRDTPILMLSARGEISDKVVGLELGADDYMAKPFEPRELVARIQSILKRADRRVSSTHEKIEVSDLVIDLEQRSVTRHGEEIHLSTAEFEVLKLLASNPKRVYTRDQIVTQIHGEDWAASDRGPDIIISRVRDKLGDDPKHPRYIRTIRGVGYKFLSGK